MKDPIYGGDIRRLNFLSWQKRKQIAKEMGVAPDPRTLDDLITIMVYDTSQQVRAAAEEAIVKLGPSATQPIVGRLVGMIVTRDWLDEPYPDRAEMSRERIRRALVRIGAQAISSVSAQLTHKDWAVRDEAKRLLARIKSAGVSIELSGDT